MVHGNYINLFVPGHSHFEQIVNRVKKAVAKRRQDLNIDDLDGLSGEERNEVSPETNVWSSCLIQYPIAPISHYFNTRKSAFRNSSVKFIISLLW